MTRRHACIAAVGLLLVGYRGTAAAQAFLARFAWRDLERSQYRATLETGELTPGLVADSAVDLSRPTVVFIHGAEGTPARFGSLADALEPRANIVMFVYDDTAPLVQSAERLRAGLLALGSRPHVLVAHSMGALLPAYAGATDLNRQLRCTAAVYLNPLIGGSHYADDIPALRWLQGLKPYLQRAFFPTNVQDLTPDSVFEQIIFGRASQPSSFAARTVLLFTEHEGEEPGIAPGRIPHFFGRPRDVLLQRLGRVRTVSTAEATGHSAPLFHPDIVVPLVTELLDQVPSTCTASL